MSTETYYVLQGWYPAYGWEDLTAEDTIDEIRTRLREYRENEPETTFRIRRRIERTGR